MSIAYIKKAYLKVIPGDLKIVLTFSWSLGQEENVATNIAAHINNTIESIDSMILFNSGKFFSVYFEVF